MSGGISMYNYAYFLIGDGYTVQCMRVYIKDEEGGQPVFDLGHPMLTEITLPKGFRPTDVVLATGD